MPLHQQAVAVYGASGHTARFVIAELQRRGLDVVAVGRDAATLPSGVPQRVAALDEPAALDRAFAGCGVVINCAGPFLDTAAPVVEAALRVRAAYLDVTAEQASALDTFERHDAAARSAGVAVIPAAGFYGGLADLLATVLADGKPVDDMQVAVALDHWWPTPGTRRTGERNQVPRVVVEDGMHVPMTPAHGVTWTFDAPHGAQPMEAMAFSEIITIPRHLQVRNLHAYLNSASLGDIRDASTPPPTSVDAHGRSAQHFSMQVVAARASGRRRAIASGRDIYAVTAPLVAEAAERMLRPGFDRAGAMSLGQAFDAADFLRALPAGWLDCRFEPA